MLQIKSTSLWRGSIVRPGPFWTGLTISDQVTKLSSNEGLAIIKAFLPPGTPIRGYNWFIVGGDTIICSCEAYITLDEYIQFQHKRYQRFYPGDMIDLSNTHTTAILYGVDSGQIE